jgi:(2R)-ethylmalonyl-CoA mutase
MSDAERPAHLLSGSHVELADQRMTCLEQSGAADEVAVIFGGIIPKEDMPVLLQRGIKRIFTPSDFDPAEVIGALLDLVEEQSGALTT